MGDVLTDAETRRAAESLRRVIASIEAEELEATVSVLERLRGALVALEALLGDEEAEG